MAGELRPVRWVASTKKDFCAFPDSVQAVMGFALYVAQVGGRHPDTKLLKGFGGGVVEIIEDHDGDTFRTVYTVRFEEAVYVLHAFQKKSKHGVQTPKQDIDLIESRLKQAGEYHRQIRKARGSV